MGQISHSDAGPNRSTRPHAKIPSAIPNRKSARRNGASRAPYTKKERPKTILANTSITSSPTELVAIAASTKPVMYSDIESGLAKTFKKLRDHTSSKNAVVTPCITRIKKSHSRTAPSSAGTKLKPEEAMAFRYLVMNPHSTMSTVTHANS